MEISELVEEVDIGEYIGQFVDLKPEGKELFGLCPFHEEQTPSFSVTPQSHRWYCFGCHQGGSVLSFVMKYHHISKEDAVKILCQYAGIDVRTMHRNTTNQIMRQLCTEVPERPEIDRVPLRDDVMNQFEDNPEKLKVWGDEGIHPTVLENHQVRYDPKENRLVYPIYGMDGKIFAVCGRTLDPDYKAKKIRKYSYYQKIGTMDTLYGLYENIEFIKQQKEVIIFEGAKSVMKAESYGYNNTVALQTSHINPAQTRILIGLQCNIILALDTDVDVRKDSEVCLLKRYAKVYWARNYKGVLGEKMSPVDAGKDVWEEILAHKIRLN